MGKGEGSHFQAVSVTCVSRAVDFTGTTVGLAQVSALCSRASGAVNQVKGTPLQVYWNWPVGWKPAQSLSWTYGGGHAGPWSTPEGHPPGDGLNTCVHVSRGGWQETAPSPGAEGEGAGLGGWVRRCPSELSPLHRTTARTPLAWHLPWPTSWATTWA